jgi:hypothetical protein
MRACRARENEMLISAKDVINYSLPRMFLLTHAGDSLDGLKFDVDIVGGCTKLTESLMSSHLHPSTRAQQFPLVRKCVRRNHVAETRRMSASAIDQKNHQH